MLRNDKGFTLTEVIVGMVISTIVLSCIVIYTVVGIRNFGDARAETQAQQESDFIASMLRDKLKTVQSFNISDEGNYYTLELISGEADEESDKYHLTDYAFIYDKVNTDMYMINYTDDRAEDSWKDDEGNYVFEFTSSDYNPATLKRTGLLSSYVTGFETDTSMYDKDKTIGVNVEVTFGKTKIRRSFSGFMRNKSGRYRYGN